MPPVSNTLDRAAVQENGKEVAPPPQGVIDIVQEMNDRQAVVRRDNKAEAGSTEAKQLVIGSPFGDAPAAGDAPKKEGHTERNKDGSTVYYAPGPDGKDLVRGVMRPDGSRTLYEYNAKGELNSLTEQSSDGKKSKYNSTDGTNWVPDESTNKDKKQQPFKGTLTLDNDGTQVFIPADGKFKGQEFVRSTSGENYRVKQNEDGSKVEFHKSGDNKEHPTVVHRTDGSTSKYAYDKKGNLSMVEEYDSSGELYSKHISNDGNKNWIQKVGGGPPVVTGEMSVTDAGVFQFRDQFGNLVEKRTNNTSSFTDARGVKTEVPAPQNGRYK